LANPFWIEIVRTGLALKAVETKDSALAQEQYIALTGLPGKTRGAFICGDRLMGLLSQTMGNPDQAVAHFKNALAFCRKEGFRPELAWTCHDYADTLLQRNDPSDHVQAISLLDEAWFISRELGMRPLMEWVAARQDRMASLPPPPPVYPNGLTQREVEVLRLIAAGRSNSDIAAELVISLNTVARHVSNIFSKTGATNRAETATYAYRHGLVQ
jgi:DNA-binding CsgD family transcriptional regulator